jgi:hypothetical protein
LAGLTKAYPMTPLEPPRPKPRGRSGSNAH